MEPSPLHFVSHTHYYRGGDVVVDESAAIAPGVVFRAAPNASIRVGPCVCVGAGVVIQAKQGCIFIEAGASIGTGVLIVGQGHVGKDACVGPSSTLINPAIAANEIIPPCSLVEAPTSSSGATPSPTSSNGTSSFQPSGFQATGFKASKSQSTGYQNIGFQSAGVQGNGSQSTGAQNTGFQANSPDPVPSMPIPPRTTPTVEPQAVSPKAVHVPNIDPVVPLNGPDGPENPGGAAITKPNGNVYGRDHVNSLLSALFPHRHSLNNGDTNNNQYREDF